MEQCEVADFDDQVTTLIKPERAKRDVLPNVVLKKKKIMEKLMNFHFPGNLTEIFYVNYPDLEVVLSTIRKNDRKRQ